MIYTKLATFRDFRIKWKYEVLLISFLILIFGDIFFYEGVDAAPYLILQNVFASVIIFYGKKRWRFPLVFLMTAIISLVVVNMLFDFRYIRLAFAIIYIIYFAFISTEVFAQVVITKNVTGSMVSAVLCGFIIIGLIGGYVFSIIEVLHTGSFNNLSEGVNGVADLIYFSFITVLSVGYGDITPATLLAKKAAMFIGLIGYFYGVVAIGIIIGKFIAKNNN
ncbi:MAG: two pore domain potassium channel family protein [Draconibacterium sp.]|nr:two pore domain potassium channel family protein [Draconibacterium sp.]